MVYDHIMSIIPPESNFEEICDTCKEFHVPFWTNCKCDRPISIKIEELLRKHDPVKKDPPSFERYFPPGSQDPK